MDNSNYTIHRPSNHLVNYINGPYVHLSEQPYGSHRFRYEREMEKRLAAKIAGVNSTTENRTVPAIQVMNYRGSYIVVVSCVTKDTPYRPHPNNLVGNDCKRGVCIKLVKNANTICCFPNLGIQRVLKKSIKESLRIREELRIDPFGTGFNNFNNIDLKVLRLCFQVFLLDSTNTYSKAIPPVVSEPIYNKTTLQNLTIVKISHYSASVTGDTEIILLCGRVEKEDVEIWFYEEKDSKVIWENRADFLPSDVYKQFAISFRTPRYFNENVHHPVSVFIQLRKPSEHKRGEPRPFQYLPAERDPEGLKRKKLKIAEHNDLLQYFQVNVLGNSSSAAQEHQLPIGIPRVSRQRSPKQMTKADSSMNTRDMRKNTAEVADHDEFLQFFQENNLRRSSVSQVQQEATGVTNEFGQFGPGQVFRAESPMNTRDMRKNTAEVADHDSFLQCFQENNLRRSSISQVQQEATGVPNEFGRFGPGQVFRAESPMNTRDMRKNTAEVADLRRSSVSQVQQEATEVPNESGQFGLGQMFRADSPMISGGGIFPRAFSSVDSDYYATSASQLPTLPLDVFSTTLQPDATILPSVLSHSSPMESLPSTIMQNIMPLFESLNQDHSQACDNNTMIEKFDSLDLDFDLNIEFPEDL